MMKFSSLSAMWSRLLDVDSSSNLLGKSNHSVYFCWFFFSFYLLKFNQTNVVQQNASALLPPVAGCSITQRTCWHSIIFWTSSSFLVLKCAFRQFWQHSGDVMQWNLSHRRNSVLTTLLSSLKSSHPTLPIILDKWQNSHCHQPQGRASVGVRPVWRGRILRPRKRNPSGQKVPGGDDEKCQGNLHG